MHGVFGEDGSIQEILDKNNIIYNGSPSSSSKNCFDKNFTKVIAQDNDISTPRSTTIDRQSAKIGIFVWSRFDSLKFSKCVIKPNKQGSSIGFSIINDGKEIEDALQSVFEHDSVALIEDYIEGREITVSILDKQALPVIDIQPNHGIYDYRAKYTKGETQYICPAQIDSSLSIEIQNAALKVHQLLDCKVYSRVDFRLDKNNKFWLLEINTLPGMTETSLFPMAAKAVGLSFEDLIDKIIKLSLEK